MLENTNIGGSLLIIKFFFMVVIYNRKKGPEPDNIRFRAFL
jgi:hypothetical protein